MFFFCFYVHGWFVIFFNGVGRQKQSAPLMISNNPWISVTSKVMQMRSPPLRSEFLERKREGREGGGKKRKEGDEKGRRREERTPTG